MYFKWYKYIIINDYITIESLRPFFINNSKYVAVFYNLHERKYLCRIKGESKQATAQRSGKPNPVQITFNQFPCKAKGKSFPYIWIAVPSAWD